MSMIYVLHQASDETIEGLLADPESVLKFLGMERHGHTANRGCLSLLFAIFRENRAAAAPGVEPEAGSAVAPADELPSCDLDKAWHGLHFLLSGSAWEGEPPAAFLLNWGAGIGEVDVGYGPARALTQAQTAEIGDFLDGIDQAELRSRFDPELMMHESIYPTIWDRDPTEDDTLGYVMEYFDILRQFVRRTANDGLGMVVYLG